MGEYIIVFHIRSKMKITSSSTACNPGLTNPRKGVLFAEKGRKGLPQFNTWCIMVIKQGWGVMGMCESQLQSTSVIIFSDHRGQVVIALTTTTLTTTNHCSEKPLMWQWLWSWLIHSQKLQIYSLLPSHVTRLYTGRDTKIRNLSRYR